MYDVIFKIKFLEFTRYNFYFMAFGVVNSTIFVLYFRSENSDEDFRLKLILNRRIMFLQLHEIVP